MFRALAHLYRQYLTIFLALAVLLVGCTPGTNGSPSAGGPSGAATGTFVGQVAGTDAFIGLVTDGKTVQGYYCDGTADKVSMAGWLNGPVSSNAASVTGANGAKLAVQFTPQGAAGTLTTPDGKALVYSAVPATGSAGLYRAEKPADGGKYVGGWIVLNDGQQRGSVTKSTSLLTVPSIQPGSTDADLGNNLGRVPLRRYITPTLGVAGPILVMSGVLR